MRQGQWEQLGNCWNSQESSDSEKLDQERHSHTLPQRVRGQRSVESQDCQSTATRARTRGRHSPPWHGFLCHVIASCTLGRWSPLCVSDSSHAGKSVPSFVLSDAFLIKTVIIGAFPKVLLGEFAFLRALPQLAFYLSLINK